MVGTVNVLSPPNRVLTDDKGAELLKLLPSDTKKITVTSVMGDAEAFSLAIQIKKFLDGKGFTVDGVDQGVFTAPISGVNVNVSNPNNVQINVGSR